MKILVIQCGPLDQAVVASSLLVGLQKKYHNAVINWVGSSEFLPLLRYNKKLGEKFSIEQELDFSVLSHLYGTDLIVNTSEDKRAVPFTSAVISKNLVGFSGQNHQQSTATLLSRILSGKTKTHKHIIDLYYGLAGLKWNGQGYGLAYYPKTKQTREAASYLTKTKPKDAPKDQLKLGKSVLEAVDSINRYKAVTTDDLFVTHIAIALRKDVTLVVKEELPYRIEFFGNGLLSTV